MYYLTKQGSMEGRKDGRRVEGRRGDDGDGGRALESGERSRGSGE